MNRGPTLDYYFGVLRKHWLQILVVGMLVVAGGWVYHSREIPAFEAVTKLKIIRQTARRTGADVPFTFEEDQVFYNTQYNLLTTQLDWADQALDRAAYRTLVRLGGWPEQADAADRAVEAAHRLTGAALVDAIGRPSEGDEFAPLEDPDPKLAEAVARVRRDVIAGSWHLTPDSFLAGVKAAPIPNTYLAELSFTAADPGLSVLFANLYAELYRDVSTEERVETVEKQLSLLTDRREELESALDAARKGLRTLRAEHPELALGPSMNLPQQEADAIATRINGLEMEQIVRRTEEEKVKDLLGSRSIGVVAPADGPLRLEPTGGGDGAEGLFTLLATDSEILGLSAVGESEGVARVRGRIRSQEEALARLRLDRTEQSPEVQRAREKLRDEVRELGREVAGAIVRFLQTGRDRTSAIEDLRSRLEEKRTQAQALNELYSDFLARTEQISGLSAQRDGLSREIDALRELQDSKDQQAGAGPLTIQNIGIERRARLVDARQIRPNTTMILLLTAIAAFFLSVGSAFLVEFLDDTIKTKEDFERLVAVPDIGFIPRISEKEFTKKDLAVVEKPRSGVAEAFRSIRTGILFSRKDEEIRSFLITSAGPGEGKTTVAVNLAITMAEAGRGPVLLIDADLRKPRVHAALGLDNAAGLTNCLVGNAALEESVRETVVPNLHVLTAGPTPPNPAELLGGHRMAEILEKARERYGKVVLDTPPLVAVTDTCLLAPLVDGKFLVISVGKTSWRLIIRGKEALSAVGVEATGAILNNIRSRQRGYGYGYGYGRYGEGYGESD